MAFDINKFGVPTSGSNSSQGLLMPKLKYRFRVQFVNFGAGANPTELTTQVVDIKRPSVNFNPITLDIYNSKIYLQGKPEWTETTINLRDDAQGHVAKLVGQQVQKQFDFLEQASAASGIDYKFALKYEMLDGANGNLTPNVLETWYMYGCLISQVDYGDMNYSTNDPVQIALTIRYDNALQAPEGSDTGVGFAIGRAVGQNALGGAQ
jgi:hypothetical protein